MAGEFAQFVRWKRVNLRCLCLRPPDQFDQEERSALDEVLLDDDRLEAGNQLLQWLRG